MGCAQSSCNDAGEDGKSRLHALVHEKKVMRKLLLVVLMGRAQSRRRGKEAAGVGENNDGWLLADSPAATSGDGAAAAGDEPHSVHSSFRFSFGSRVEVESFGLGSPAAAVAEATVLMVNLEKSSAGSPGGVSGRVRQVELLDRSVSSVDPRLIRFSYAEVCSATHNFCRGKILGRGANSCVFRGRLGLRRVIAIKRLDEADKDSAKAFYRELMIASSLDHSRIAPLVGFCVAPEGLFLVYRFVAGGSLESHLHDKKRAGKALLSWSARYKVALGIADATAYLHNGTDKCVVHRDIKPSNILLSSRKRPKLCDFGLATWTPAPSVPFLCKTVKGTFGYLAPEYFQHGKVSDKTDVYAFGVVLLELLTGRKPIETGRGSGEENLVLWAQPLIRKGAVEELIDPRLNYLSCDLSQVTRLAQAAHACLTSEESARPSIDQVVSLLRGREHGTPAGLSYIPRNGSIGCYFQSCELQANNEMKSHIALAMLGVTDFEEAELYCR